MPRDAGPAAGKMFASKKVYTHPLSTLSAILIFSIKIKMLRELKIQKISLSQF
jgi:hypothetical protein